MNKNEFQPIDLKKVREQVEKERIEKKEDQEQKSVFVEERELLGMPFYFYSHYNIINNFAKLLLNSKCKILFSINSNLK